MAKATEPKVLKIYSIDVISRRHFLIRADSVRKARRWAKAELEGVEMLEELERVEVTESDDAPNLVVDIDQKDME